jgi:hypothetical protein
MIAMSILSQNPSCDAPKHSAAAIEQTRVRAGSASAGDLASIVAVFQPLDPAIVSDTIPAFFIGRNMEGFWVARDANGKIGGIFLLESSALSFARKNSWPAGCATIFPSQRFELDLENSGNPLVPQLRPLVRLARRHRQRVATLIGKMTEAVKRRLDKFRVL